MSTLTIDQAIATTPEIITSEVEANTLDLLAFTLGMIIIFTGIFIMSAVGAITASAPLLATSGVTGLTAAFIGIYTGINLMSA